MILYTVYVHGFVAQSYTQGRPKGKPCVNGVPVWTLENLQEHGEPSFTGTDILGGRCAQQIPRRDTDVTCALWRASLMYIYIYKYKYKYIYI
jgi:hypothetical protein